MRSTAGLPGQVRGDAMRDPASAETMSATLATWLTRHPLAGSALVTLLFCTLIAFGLASVFDGFVDNFVVSICIGLSILVSSFTVQSLFGERVPLVLLQFIAVPLGLLSGLAFGGAYLSGQPGYFFVGTGRAGIGLGVLFGVIGSLGFVAMHALANLRAELALRRLREAEQARQLTTAHLRVLQAQMEPHFLFNTISNVVALIDHDPPRARELLVHLTALLRASLERSRREITTLGDELELTEAYLRIQSLRMGARLRWRIDCPSAMRSARLPPLVLQPLVENAVRHGIEPAERGGEVVVEVRRDAGELTLSVRDTGIGIDAASAPASRRAGGGTSLPNLRDRLFTLYGPAARVTITPLAPEGTCVEVRVPLAEEPAP